jgi:hypothetical protein
MTDPNMEFKGLSLQSGSTCARRPIEQPIFKPGRAPADSP